MKKIYSLIRACITNDMQLFKIKTKKNSKMSSLIPLIIAFYLMFMIWCSANGMFEKLEPMQLQYIVLPIAAFSISVMTIIEGIYKIGTLIFNCKDDQLLLSLPIKKTTVLFIRIFKFYVFELLFNSLFLLPFMIAYIRWGTNINWTYYLTSIVMLLTLPIIPIVISCIIGVITSGISSRLKYKNVAQTIISMTILIGILLISFKMEGIFNYLVEHATSINDLITKIYYPSGVYAKLLTEFNIIDLILFILSNITIFIISIFILSKFYFKINSRLKKVTSTKKVKINKLNFKARNKTLSLIKKELNTFFKTPVFIINSGFALILFIIAIIIISLRFDSTIQVIIESNIFSMTKEEIMNKISIFIFLLILITSYMTSITNSVISLEGKNINMLKSLPIKTKTILMSKIYSSLILTTPILLIGDIILFIRFKTNIIESILLIILSILIPLVSHFIGILVNLKYPKLDAESSTEIVKQSTSSLLSTMIEIILLIISCIIIKKVIGINSIIILMVSVLIYTSIDLILYAYLTKQGVEEFNNLSI